MNGKLWLRRLAILAVIAAAAYGGWRFWRARAAAESAPAFRTETVVRGTVDETVTATGTLSAVTTVQVGSQVSGIVASLHADFNSRVRRGQLLAELDPTPFQATVEQRRADLQRAEVQMRAAGIAFGRQKRLLSEELTAEADFDAAKADYDAAKATVDQAEAALRQAQTNLTYTKIDSPIDGVVVARQYDVGQTVAASFQAPTLFTIAQDLTKMQVQADVDQADIGKIAVGQDARFTVDAYPDTTFRAKISQVRLNATANQNVITYPVILTVDNPEQKLRPQMTANVTISVATIADVLRIPNAALRFRPVETASGNGVPKDAVRAAADLGRANGGVRGASEALDAATREAPKPGQTIWVLDDAGKPAPTRVRTGITDGRFTAVVGGDLKEGDAVIVGLATAKGESSSGFPGAMGPRGGRRM